MNCRDLCKRFPDQWTKKNQRVQAYMSGYRRCGHCEIVYLTNDFLCKCCHRKLSCKPSGGYSRQRLIELSLATGEIKYFDDMHPKPLQKEIVQVIR